MLVVKAELKVKPDKKAELFLLAKDVIAATRAEEGCVSYSLMDDPHDPCACAFIEEWVDKAALQRHFATPHLAEWRKKSTELLTGKPVIKLYQAEETTL